MPKSIFAKVNATITNVCHVGTADIFSQHGHLNPENGEKTCISVQW
jgi:hypothetical protein